MPMAMTTNTAPATFGRRLIAVAIDWLACNGIVLLVTDFPAGTAAASFVPLLVFMAANIVLVSITGATLGMALLGLRVGQVRPGIWPVQVTIRTVLLALVIPAVLTAADGSGLHDAAAGTRIVRVR